jgi:signal transduction histidine kinase
MFMRCWGLLLCLALLTAGCGNRAASSDETDRYDYRDTRHLVRLVRAAADRVAGKGAAAFDLFRGQPQQWTYKDAYIYVYDATGVCLFHGGTPELEGHQLWHVRDITGKSSLQLAFRMARNPANPHGWVHYAWNAPRRLYPEEKSSCHFLVTTPSGDQVLVGGGLPDLPVERGFVQFAVDEAVALLEREGLAALETIRSPASEFRFLDTAVFVFTADGATLVDPALSLPYSRNILDYEDDSGHKPLRQLIARLQTEQAAWVVLASHNPHSINMEKKGLYGRLCRVGERELYVAGISDLPKPAWMN